MQYHHEARPKRWKRALLIVTAVGSGLIVLAFFVLWLFSDTDWGRERVRRFVERRLNGMVHGQASIGRISGNLLAGATLHDVVIRDTTGKPFVAVESMSGDYSILSLLRKRIWIRHAVLVRPLVVLDKPPDGKWNWRRIFPRDTTPKPPSQQVRWGDWLKFTDTRVVEGRLVVQTAWHPSTRLTPRGRDSAVQEVLSGQSRLLVKRVLGGFQKTVELDSVSATIPLLRLSEPGIKDRLIQVSALRMLAYPFRPPAADVRNVLGSFSFDDDSVWWKSAYAVMSQSKFSGDGRYVFDSGDMSLMLHGVPAVFADLKWLYPRLPANGRGRVDLAVLWRGATSDYHATNIDVTANGAHILGSLGITQTDSIAIYGTDLRFTNVDTRLIEQTLKGFTSPRQGVVSGHAIVQGGKHALVVDGDVTFADVRAGTSRVIARGEVGFLDNGGVRARGLHVDMRPFQLEMLRDKMQRMPISGIVTGTATLEGSTNSALNIRGDIEHRDRGTLSRATGNAAISLVGARRFDIDVVAHPVSLAEVGRLAPTLDLRGDITGPIHVVGTSRSITINGDIEHRDRGELSRATGKAVISLVGERRFDIDVVAHPVSLVTVGRLAPAAKLEGSVTGPIHVAGTRQAITVDGDVEHRNRGEVSKLTGNGNFQLAGAKRFDVDVNAHPLSLVEVGRYIPSAGLRGSATGPIGLAGTLPDFRFDTDVTLNDSARLVANGRLVNITHRDRSYDFAAVTQKLNLRTVLVKAPSTSLTGRVAARGTGTEPTTMTATVDADLSKSRVDTIGVDSAIVRGSLADGLARLARFEVRAPKMFASAQGAFGLVRGRSGELTYRVAIDSLGAFGRFVPRGMADTGMVAPRPLSAARALVRARADSARIDRATEIERAATGRAPPTLARVARPRPVPREGFDGSLLASGVLRGNPYEFDLRGQASGKNVVARGNSVGRFASEYAWRDARTPQSVIAVAIDADSVSALGFQFDSVGTRVAYRGGTSGVGAGLGDVEVLLRQDRQRDYSAKGDFSLNVDSKQLRIADMTLRFDTVQWRTTRPALVQWGRAGVQVDNFELRDRGIGRVYAHGLLPTKGAANFEFEVVNFPLSNVTDLTQTDIELAGITTLRGTMTGTLDAPAFRGAFGVLGGKYNATPVPELRGTFGYADRQLVTHVDAVRKGTGQSFVKIDGRIPVNLAFTGVTGSRLLADPLTMDLETDSLPVELIPEFTDLVSNVHGHVAGKVAVRGTLKNPTVAGGFLINRGTMTVTASGATVEQITGAVRMLNDSIYVDSIVGVARGPVRLRGTLGVGDWGEPSFNLYLVTESAELLNNQHGKLRMDAAVALTGPFRQAYLSGQVNVVSGVIQAPEPSGRHAIGAGDPALFNVLDTSIVAERELFPAHSPLLANLRIEVALNVRHDTWVRNRDANVEIYTEYPMMLRAESEALALTGVVTTDRGDYKFLSKRFQIKRGSAIFIGTPDLNPTLQITGEYQVQLATRAAIDVRVLIGGTLKRPKLSLESNAQPPKTQSELLSLLAFGQSTTSLLTLNGSSVVGSGTSDVFGIGAQLAVRRLAAVALGVAVDEIETEAGKALGTDVLNITPADVPVELIQARGLGSFLTQTKIEAGKYVNPRTFVTTQESGGRFGAGIEHRTADGWHFTASFEPRLLLREPTLSGQTFRPVKAYGGMIAREWRLPNGANERRGPSPN